MTRVLRCTIALLLATSIAPGARASSASQPHHVIAYLSDGIVGGGVIVQWRIFDPVTRSDSLLRSFSGREPTGIYWDSSETSVEYVDGVMLYKMAWEWGAQPWSERPMPVGGTSSDWWFEPDSSRWRVEDLTWVGSRGRQVRSRRTQWRSDRTGQVWSPMPSDTVDCNDCNLCFGWKAPDPPGSIRRGDRGYSQSVEALTVTGWGAPPVTIQPPSGDGDDFNWIHVSFRSMPGRGIALRAGRLPNGTETLMAPIYLVDRAHHTQRLLDTPGLTSATMTWRIGMDEDDGFLLITGIRTSVYDLNTGDQIFRSSAYRPGVWIRPPAPARVDTLGLRRLRERFR